MLTQKEMMLKWVQLLRSGKYKQGNFRLKQPDDFGAKYCCLGVVAEGVLDREFREVSSGNLVYAGGGTNGCSNLVTKDSELLGLDTLVTEDEFTFIEPFCNSTFSSARDREDALMSLNDGGASFEDIAYIIEELGW